MKITPSSPFVTTNIIGGLGNQLFLVSNLLATARRHNISAVLPRLQWSSSCDAPRPTYWSSLFSSLESFGVEYVPENASCFQERKRIVVPESRPVSPVVLSAYGDPGAGTHYFDLVGFFQSESFFKDFPVIQNVVSRRLHQLAEALLRNNYITTEPYRTHTVGLHLRRGDYTQKTNTFEQLDMTSYYDPAVRQLLGGLLLKELQARSMSAAAEALHLQILIFCEELQEGKLAVGYLRSRYPGLHITHVHPSNEERAPFEPGAEQPREVVELLMMAQCNDLVIANSTFSWWAAYLNQRPLRRVVAPVRWFTQHPYPQHNHLYCDDWVLL